MQASNRTLPPRLLPPLVKRLRRERGMSQEALAFASNVTASTLSRIERGLHHPTLSTLTRIAQALEVPPAELIAAADMDAGRTPNAES